MKIGDIEAAFLRENELKRPTGKVLVRLPPGGIPELMIRIVSLSLFHPSTAWPMLLALGTLV